MPLQTGHSSCTLIAYLSSTKGALVSIYTHLVNQILLLTWRDAAEIIFFTTCFYYLILWLNKDREKRLLPYFYGYCAITFVSHALHLSTITYSLFLFSPAIIMLLLSCNAFKLLRIMHESQS